METQYIIIKCGHEGIEGMLYLHTDTELIKEKILSLRQNILDKREYIKTEFGVDYYAPDSWIAIDELYFSDKIDCEIYNAISDDPNQYCVQKWDGEYFVCCCNELGVEPTKTWLM